MTEAAKRKPRYLVAALILGTTVVIAVLLVVVLSQNVVYFRTVSEAVHDRKSQGRDRFRARFNLDQTPACQGLEDPRAAADRSPASLDRHHPAGGEQGLENRALPRREPLCRISWMAQVL